MPNCDYEPKGQEFGCTLFEELPHVSGTEDSTDTTSINVLDNLTKDNETHDIKTLQKRMCTANVYTIPYIYP